MLDIPMTPLSNDWLEVTEGFLIDLDGTLIRDGQALPGAARLLERLQGRFMVVSNNSTDEASGLARSLQRLGLPITAEQLVLAGEVAVRWVARHHPQWRVMIAGSESLVALARMLGLELTQQSPDAVLLARDIHFDYQRLTGISNLLRQGARLLVTNPDTAHPGAGERGVVPETGALMQAVMACSGVSPDRVFGKPESALFEEALRRLGIEQRRAVVIGDNPQTDGFGAHRLGMPCLLVGVGSGRVAKNPDGLLETVFNTV